MTAANDPRNQYRRGLSAATNEEDFIQPPGLIQQQAQQLRALCLELGIPLSDGNAVCERLLIAERWSASPVFTIDDTLIQKAAQEILRPLGDFILLAPCLLYFGTRLKEGDHIEKLTHHDTFASKFLELRTAHLVEDAGYPATFPERPGMTTKVTDVIIKVDDDLVGLECKRLTSLRNLPNNISDARDQIADARKERMINTGMIVADISGITEFPILPVYKSTALAKEAIVESVAQRSAESQRKIPKKLAGLPGGTVLFICDHCCIIEREKVDKKIHCDLFHCSHQFFYSRTMDRKSIRTLEKALGAPGPTS